jgi:hypothetical protein
MEGVRGRVWGQSGRLREPIRVAANRRRNSVTDVLVAADEQKIYLGNTVFGVSGW